MHVEDKKGEEHYTFGDCVVPKELHQRKGISSTQTSLVIRYGEKSATVCESQHWKTHAKWIREAFKPPLASTAPKTGEEVYSCYLEHCGNKFTGPKKVSGTLLLFSKRYPDSPIAVFCSIDHMLEWSSRNTSDSKISKLCKPLKEYETTQVEENQKRNKKAQAKEEPDDSPVKSKKQKVVQATVVNSPTRSSPRRNSNKYASPPSTPDRKNVLRDRATLTPSSNPRH
jgi:hypothetical protein